MNEIGLGRPRIHRSDRSKRGLRAFPVLLVTAALLAGCAGPAPSGLSGVTPSSGPTTGTSGSPSPSGQPSAWTPVTVAAMPPVATLEPTKAGAAGVAADTEFRLTSLDGRAPAVLAAGLVADPPITFTVASTSGASAVLRPTAPLAEGTLYRISLRRPDGTVEAAWAAQSAAAPAVVETVPANQSTGVPVDTGIELTFNQAGIAIADLTSHVTIVPAVSGHLEAAGRTFAFVPDQPLANATAYTVTVAAGMPLAGTGQARASPFVFRFETASTTPPTARLSFVHTSYDATPRERAAMSIYLDVLQADAPTPSQRVAVTVHQLPTLASAMAAYTVLAAETDWALASTTPSVATTSLHRVLGTTVTITQTPPGAQFVLLPQALTAGWYLVTATYQGTPHQAVLQVSDAATFTLVSINRSLVWVNDLRTGAPAAGATASLDGHALGTADANGLINAPTPTTVRGPDANGITLTSTTAPAAPQGSRIPILTVTYRGMTTFRPVILFGACSPCATPDGLIDTTPASNAWWALLSLDRTQYRSTDTVSAFGVVRSRDTGTIPASVTLTVWLSDAGMRGASPVVTASATPDKRGMFSAPLALQNLPTGSYRVRLAADGVALTDAWFDVLPYVKPAWQLTVTPARHAIISGETLQTTAQAQFFEGTPVAGVALNLGSDSADSAPTATATTAIDGTATASLSVPLNASVGQWGWVGVTVQPTLPEEADLAQTTEVAVFRSSAYVSLDAVQASGRLAITGSVNSVAFSRYETAAGIANPGSVDPKGDGRVGASVRITVVEQVPYSVRTGTAYDFVTKRVAPTYEMRFRTVTISRQTVRTGAYGAFHLNLHAAGGTSTYVVTAAYTDTAGRTASETSWASATVNTTNDWFATLTATNPTADLNGYSIGDTVRVRFSGGLLKPPAARYLYAVSGRNGLNTAIVSTSQTFATTFAAADVPSMRLSGIRFNGVGYETAVAGYTARLRQTDRKLTVQIAPDKSRYQPGGTATVSILTLDPAGRPLAASVFVRAVDEKLYAIGAASDGDPLYELYADMGDGILGSAVSHQTPEADGGGSGSTGGGGSSTRADFRDWLIAKVVTTGADGRATVSIPLSSDLTSWHVAGTAVDAGLDVGLGSTQLAVGLPFFVDTTLAPTYIAADRPVLRLRAFGSGLKTGQSITFTVSSPTLPMVATTVTASAFQMAEVPLPVLSLGTQTLHVTASAGTGAGLLSDAMDRTFTVIANRAVQLRTTWVLLTTPTGLQAGTGATSLILADAGRGRVIPILQDLAGSTATRADTALASALATRVLATQFGLAAPAPTDENALSPFVQDGGLSIVPWGSANLDATVLAALAGDTRVNVSSLRQWLLDLLAATDTPRDGRLLVLAGLAALGEPVLDEIQASAALADLTMPEQVDAALAALFAGDDTLARQLEQQVLAAHGERLGGLVRLDTADGSEAAVTTARLAIVAASLGDPIAADMDAWLAANPPATTTVAAERALAARGWALRVAGAAAVVALTVDGTRKQLTLEPGAPTELALTSAQAAGARLEPVSGSALVIQSWEDALSAANLTTPAGLTISRSVTPSGTIGTTDTVTVTYHIELGTHAGNGTWRLVDMVPSGLAPLANPFWAAGPQGGVWTGETPVSVVGQRVEFLVGGDPKRTTYDLRYTARVVSPGTYAWEPAALQQLANPAAGAVVPATTITIAGG